jgi:pilus assembly protein CpaE
LPELDNNRSLDVGEPVLRTVIICPADEAAKRLETALKELGLVSVLRVLDHYPDRDQVIRLLRANAPTAIFLSFESMARAQETMRLLESEAQGIPIIAVHRVLDQGVLRETMRTGVREFVEYPFERQTLIDAIKNTADLLEHRPLEYKLTDQIFSFLPSKAGAGASTMALNVSAALSRRKDTRVLLSDFDLNSGMLRFLLKLGNEYSIVNAVEKVEGLDENVWPQLVTSLNNLDLLHAGPVNPGLRIDISQIRKLIQFMRRNYGAICFDLSGNLERYAIEIMLQSKRVLLVCTPEIPSLHLAREKIQFLKSMELDGRIAVVLNRLQKRPLFGKSDVEDLLGMPVLETLPNDYQAVTRAVTAGEIVDPKSELGKKFAGFADSLIDADAPKPSEGRKRLLDFLSHPSPAMS